MPYFQGLATTDRRRNQLREENAARPASLYGPLSLSGDQTGGFGGRDWDAAFGALNNTGANIDVGSWGQEKALDVPTGRTYNVSAGQVAPGMRGRPSAALAALQGLSPSRGGYYTPDEWNDYQRSFGR